MRSTIAGQIPSLLGSLGLHGGIALAFLIAVRHPVKHVTAFDERADAWVGNAVEVDAVATPDSTANLPSDADSARDAPATTTETAPAPATTTPVAAAKPEGERAALVQPRPRPTRTPKPAPEKAGGSAAPPSSGSATTAGARGAFGGEGLPPGVRSLPSAFTRAIPPATGADPIWQTLPVGTERPFTIALEVDADGHISSAEIVLEKAGVEPTTEASHVRERVVALLGGGLFALQSGTGAGRELLRITITLSDTPVHDDDDPAQLVERGFEPPRNGAPGRAYFTLASGRHFEAKVQVLAQH
jgi:hypothetical protein